MRAMLALAVAMIATGAVIFGTGLASADPGNGNGAVVQRDPYGTPHTCFIVDTNGHFWTFDCTIQVVITPNGTVNEYVNGTINGGDAPPAKAIS